MTANALPTLPSLGSTPSNKPDEEQATARASSPPPGANIPVLQAAQIVRASGTAGLRPVAGTTQEVTATAPSQQVRAVISQAIVIHGNLEAKGDTEVVLMGSVMGSVVASGLVTIHPTAQVHGAIRAGALVLSGQISCPEEGDASLVEVQGNLHLKAGARLSAQRIRYGSLQIETGARVRGVLEPIDSMEDGPAAELGQTGAAASAMSAVLGLCVVADKGAPAASDRAGGAGEAGTDGDVGTDDAGQA